MGLTKGSGWIFDLDFDLDFELDFELDLGKFPSCALSRLEQSLLGALKPGLS